MPSAEVLRIGFGATRKTLGDPAGMKKPPPKQGLGTLRSWKSCAIAGKAEAVSAGLAKMRNLPVAVFANASLERAALGHLLIRAARA